MVRSPQPNLTGSHGHSWHAIRWLQPSDGLDLVVVTTPAQWLGWHHPGEGECSSYIIFISKGILGNVLKSDSILKIWSFLCRHQTNK